MSDSNDMDGLVDLTGPDEPFSVLADDIAELVADNTLIDEEELRRHALHSTCRKVVCLAVGSYCTCMHRSRAIVWQFVATATKSPDTAQPFMSTSSL